MAKQNTKTPGPGHVNVGGAWQLKQGGSTWGNFDPKTNNRSKAIMNNENVPGPGAYNTNRLNSAEKQGPAYSMASRKTSKEIMHVPGPGNYNTTGEVYNGSNGAKIGTSKRSELTGKRASIGPGPGAYTTAEASKITLSYSIGKSTRASGRRNSE